LNHTGKEGSYLTKWAQRFVYSLEGVRLKAVTQSVIRCWVEELDRNGSFEGWQLHQALKAVQILMEKMVDSADRPAINWDELGSLCEELGAEHATLARTQSAAEIVEKSLSKADCRLDAEAAGQARPAAIGTSHKKHEEPRKQTRDLLLCFLWPTTPPCFQCSETKRCSDALEKGSYRQSTAIFLTRFPGCRKWKKRILSIL